MTFRFYPERERERDVNVAKRVSLKEMVTLYRMVVLANAMVVIIF